MTNMLYILVFLIEKQSICGKESEILKM